MHHPTVKGSYKLTNKSTVGFQQGILQKLIRVISELQKGNRKHAKSDVAVSFGGLMINNRNLTFAEALQNK